MTAKEQGLPELPQTPFCLRQHDETGRTTITDGPIDPILWQRWNKVSSLYTADQMRAYALAALASDTGERGVAVAGLVPAWLAECDRLNGGAHMPFTGTENSITALTLNRCAYELSAALRAQPAGGGGGRVKPVRQVRESKLPCPKCGCPDELNIDSSSAAEASWIDCGNCDFKFQKACDEETLEERWNKLSRKKMPPFSGDTTQPKPVSQGIESNPAYTEALGHDRDEIALAAARDIAGMWGFNRSQFVSKIQVRVLEAMKAALTQPQPVEGGRSLHDILFESGHFPTEGAITSTAREIERWIATHPPAQASGAVTEAMVEVVPVVVSDAPDAHRVQFVVGTQQFHIGPDYFDTKAETEFFASMFRQALAQGGGNER